MKNKITILILLILLLVVCGISIFFGYMYFNEKNAASDMSSQIEELNTLINDLSSKNEELNTQIETIDENINDSQTQQPSNNSISTKVYYNDDNTLVLYLIENSNPQNVASSKNSEIDRRYILAYRTNNALVEETTGQFYEENGTIKFNILDHDADIAKIFNATIDENTKNGTTHIVGTYDGENIILGTETLIAN